MDQQQNESVSLYRPLGRETKEIRLLCLQPGSGREPLKGYFVYTNLADGAIRNYETISYVWGDLHSGGQIFLQDLQKDVPPNAVLALRCMRLVHKERLLWIDTVCINQGDLEERSQQVSLMAYIYARAKCNLKFLGEDVDGLAENALRHMEAVSNFVTETEHPCESQDTLGRLVHAMTDRCAVNALFSLTWFHRLWVVQEAVLAHDNLVFWGSASSALFHLSCVARYLLHWTPKSPYTLATRLGLMAASEIDEFRDYIRRVRQKDYIETKYELGKLSRLLQLAGTRACSDTRDKVFALWGLMDGDWTIPRHASRLLMPDCNKSTSEVLRDATRLAISGDLSLLEIFSGRKSNTLAGLDNLPSWVPCWFEEEAVYETRFWPLYPSGAIQASNRLLLDLSKDLNILELEGLVTDRVNDVSAAFSQDIDPYTGDSVPAEAWWQDVMSTFLRDTRMEATILDLRDTLVAHGYCFEPHDNYFRYVVVAFNDYVHGTLTVPEADEYETTENNLTSKVGTYWHLVADVCADRRFFTTHGGRCGIGPLSVKADDSVVILSGGTLPFILRQCTNKPGHHSLIGPCYVHGIMCGEAVEAYEDIGKLPETFKLR